MKRSIFVWFLVLLSVLISFAAEDEVPQWTFDDKDAKDELKDWVEINQMKPLEIDKVKDEANEDRFVLLTESLGGDPYMFPGGGWNVANFQPIDGKKYNILYLGLRVNQPGAWQIYYITEKDAQWGEVQRQNFNVDKFDEFIDLEIEITRGGWNKNTVTHFRIDPGSAAGVEAETDYISFTGIPNAPKSVDAQSKLATIWADLKSK